MLEILINEPNPHLIYGLKGQHFAERSVPTCHPSE